MKYLEVFIDYCFAAIGAWVLTEYVSQSFTFYETFILLLLLSIMIGQAEAKYKEPNP